MVAVQLAPNTKPNSPVTWSLRPWGACSQTAQRGPAIAALPRQARLVRLNNAPAKAQRVKLQRQIRTVRGSARQGGRSASSSLRSTQNHTAPTNSS